MMEYLRVYPLTCNIPSIDFDYLNKLSKADLRYLRKFIDEYYYDTISKVTPIHTNVVVKRELYRANYARRRDINQYNQPVATAPDFGTPSPEDILIEVIDKCRDEK